MLLKRICFLLSLLFICICTKIQAQNKFVKVNGSHFIIEGKPYYYIGTNYWYGGLLALNKNYKKGKKIIRRELNFLKSKGVDNLRVLAGSEGIGQINGVQRVKPSLQPEQNFFNDDILKSLDYLLFQMSKRKMHAVLYLSNNWEWSGGFLQYLKWNGKIDSATLQKKMSWDELRDETSKFYSCQACVQDYLYQVDHILNHMNFYNGKKYTDETAIMSWELANEPRPMRPYQIESYKNWISTTAAHIKSLDRHHLVTIGTEGTQGTEDSITLWKEIHQDSNIDYATIHIWPKNWGWFKDTNIKDSVSSILMKVKSYVQVHQQAATEISKPLVIEEFGLPRDQYDFAAATSTLYRDSLYQIIFDELQNSALNKGVISGTNFWAFGGKARPIKGQIFWKDGDDFMGDPPQEEQGLNSVFDVDKSTWQLIKKYTSRIKKILK